MKQKTLITNYTILGVFLAFVFINNALANPFANIESTAQQADSSIFKILNWLTMIWFMIGTFWWFFTKRGFVMLVLLPLAGWALINGRETLLSFAKTAIGS